jgi:hypothetical protein
MTRCKLIFSQPPPNRNWYGTITYVYSATDGVDPLVATATVTLIISPPAAITPTNFSWTMTYSALSYSPNVSLLTNVTSSNPGANLTVVGMGVPPGIGNVTVYPNGSYVFLPPPGWSGEWLLLARPAGLIDALLASIKRKKTTLLLADTLACPPHLLPTHFL